MTEETCHPFMLVCLFHRINQQKNSTFVGQHIMSQIFEFFYKDSLIPVFKSNLMQLRFKSIV